MRPIRTDFGGLSVVLTILVLVSGAMPVLPASRGGFGFFYSESCDDGKRLDVYSPTNGNDHPILIWIHGGGWRKGDKASVHHKPKAFVDRGFVFVAVNHRLVPQVTVGEAASDIAEAIRWVHTHAQRHGGSPGKIFVAGHSSGAHLAALTCTDDSYLKEVGLSLKVIQGCITVDCSAFDIPQRLVKATQRRTTQYISALGEDDELHIQLSPFTHVDPNTNIPPFLILYATDRPAPEEQALKFSSALTTAGVFNRVVHAKDKTHSSINLDMGLPGDEPTAAIFDFLDELTPKNEDNATRKPGGNGDSDECHNK